MHESNFQKSWLAASKYLANSQDRGFWPYLSGREYALEASAWAGLACLSQETVFAAYLKRLLSVQNQDGGWSNEPARLGSDWSTGAGLFSLSLVLRKDGLSKSFPDIIQSGNRALRWLLDNRADHYSSEAKFALLLWKGPEHDYPRGWPWTQDTFDWVEPTCYAIMSLKKLEYSNQISLGRAIALAEEYLLGLALSGGGWNFGDRTPFGPSPPADVQTSSLVLLALKSQSESDKIKLTRNWLRQKALASESKSEIAWAALALASLGENTDELLLLLCKDQQESGSISKNLLTHAVSTLALEARSKPDLLV